MTAILLALILIVGCTIGLCAAITLTGWFSTVHVRLEHQREMIKLGETQKLNALTIRERDNAQMERHLQMLEYAQLPADERKARALDLLYPITLVGPMRAQDPQPNPQGEI